MLVLLGLASACRAPTSDAELSSPSGAEPVVIAEVATEPTPEHERPMIEIPAGEFTRGVDPAELADCADACSFESPPTRVQLPSFWIDRREVSNAEYERCIASGNCAVRRLWQCTRDRVVLDDPAPFLAPDQPAVCISWAEAAGYCQGRGGRLPGRSEWEKAARGSEARRYPWGNDPPTCEHANFSACGRTAADPVGTRLDHPSPYGILDMAGNVAEWVSPDVTPEGLYEQGSDAEIRGGHFGSAPEQLRATARAFMRSTEDRSVHVGFRCASDRG